MRHADQGCVRREIREDTDVQEARGDRSRWGARPDRVWRGRRRQHVRRLRRPSTRRPSTEPRRRRTSPAGTAAPEGSAPGSSPSSDAALRQGGTLRYAHANTPSRFDPHRSTIGQDIRFFAPVYDRLVHFDGNGDLVPGLATEWEFSDDGLQFTMTLREGVVFHDGAPFDCQRGEGQHRARPDAGGLVDQFGPRRDHDDRHARPDDGGAHPLGAQLDAAGHAVAPRRGDGEPDRVREPGPRPRAGRRRPVPRHRVRRGFADRLRAVRGLLGPGGRRTRPHRGVGHAGLPHPAQRPHVGRGRPGPDRRLGALRRRGQRSADRQRARARRTSRCCSTGPRRSSPTRWCARR